MNILITGASSGISQLRIPLALEFVICNKGEFLCAENPILEKTQCYIFRRIRIPRLFVQNLEQ